MQQTRQTVKTRHYALHQHTDGRIEIEEISSGTVWPVDPEEIDSACDDVYLGAKYKDEEVI